MAPHYYRYHIKNLETNFENRCCLQEFESLTDWVRKEFGLAVKKTEETLDKVQLKNELKAIFCSSRGAEFSFLISHAQLRV